MKRALLVGINDYERVSKLAGCVADVRALKATLATHDDGSPNYSCETLTSGSDRVTRPILRKALEHLFDFDRDVLFYFSGHGTPTKIGGYLVTQEGEPDDPGLRMNDIVELSAKSKARQIVLLFDCCFSGAAGNVTGGNSIENQAQLREGVTILAASGSNEVAMEVGGHGVFTSLVLGALRGGAADVRGNVSAASLYAYVEAALGAWQQRPVYKSHADRLDPLRRCKPPVPDELLRELPNLFPQEDYKFPLNSTFEHTVPTSIQENIAIFNKFKTLRNARLLFTSRDEDLYWACLNSTTVELTPLGQFYRRLASEHLL